MHAGPRIVTYALAGALLGAPACIHAAKPTDGSASSSDSLSDESVARLLDLLPSLEGEWALFETPMLRLLAADPGVVHPAALSSMASTLEKLLAIFDRDGSLRRDLERFPIRYIHGLTRPELSFLAGIETDGMALWGPRIVLSRRLPHAHELVHIVAHLAMSSPEIANVDPLLREGVATYLGGARGRAPEVVLALGDSYLDMGLGDPTELLVPDRFFHAPTDPSIHYATAARFVQFLVEAEGWARFGEIYQLLAATDRGVAARPDASKRLQFAGVYQRPFRQLWLDFHAWRRSHPVAGVEAAIPPPGPADLELESDGRQLRLWRGENEWTVQLRAELGYPEVHLQWGERLPESFRPRLRISTEGAALLRYSLLLRPGGVEFLDLALDEILLATTPRPHQDGLDEEGGPPREFCVRLPFAQQAPPWPYDPLLWVSPRLR
jgi:hypothetical protein